MYFYIITKTNIMTAFTKTMVITLLSAAVAFILIDSIRPEPAERNNSSAVTGVVTSVTKGRSDDIVVMLDGIRGVHYIRKGIERGFNVDSLASRLLNKKVTVYYAKPHLLSRLSPVTDTRQITELKAGNQVLFSELP